MFRLTVVSGKGGTGKTCVASSLAFAIRGGTVIDLDVDEPDLGLVLNIQNPERESIYKVVPQIDSKRCIGCGICADHCVFGALNQFGTNVPTVNMKLCHGCGVCEYVCPQKAIKDSQTQIGELNSKRTENWWFLEGRLDIGEPNPVPVIHAVLEKANSLPFPQIVDGPPGTACPMVAAIEQSHFVVLVTEPTPFGLSDLVLAAETVHELQIPAAVVINRSDLGNSKETEVFCNKINVPILARLPFSKEVAHAYAEGIAPFCVDRKWREATYTVLDHVKEVLS
ncbi:4Fe-4S binding protein [Aminobacterium mobile]|jgi:MinD superfamily P-loop ATPase|uniref:4Fe-4S binding protein n=1 Tax=Aminobacterium mobile TaxID=81467 RepID=UPI0004647C8C|nr:ATP-binding protein [Aminobacterium mobile]